MQDDSSSKPKNEQQPEPKAAKTGADTKSNSAESTVPAAQAKPANGEINLNRLRLTQDFGSLAGVKKQLVSVQVRKPNRQEFVRVHPDQAFQLQTAVLELKDEREVYVVDQSLWQELGGEIVPKLIVTAVSRQNVTFLWPIKLPGADGRQDEWSRSMMEAAKLAQTEWTKVVANMSAGAYDIFTASGTLSDPTWPSVSFDELIKIAFKDKFITTPDHPVLRRLRGEV